MEPMDAGLPELDALSESGTPQETITMLQNIADEHPDAVAIVVSLLRNGWTISSSGEQIFCMTLRSATGEHEILGHGCTILDAFEEVQLKTKNFAKLLDFANAK